MSARSYVLEQGMKDTRAALERWNHHPMPILRSWVAWSLLVAVGLLTAVWVVALVSTPDTTPT